jgi:hypothetical protein
VWEKPACTKREAIDNVVEKVNQKSKNFSPDRCIVLLRPLRLIDLLASNVEGSKVAKFRLTRIEPPDWATQPELNIAGVTIAEYSAIQGHRDKLLNTVHREVERYLNTIGMYSEGKSFPDRLRMTGAYYIGNESYIAHRDPAWFQISIRCHCLERPKAGVDRDDDYLGLEIWLKCLPGKWSFFEVFRNTDSSSI